MNMSLKSSRPDSSTYSTSWIRDLAARRRIRLVRNPFTRQASGSALKSYTRSPEKYPIWREENCPGITRLTKIGPEIYMKGADDKLMPTRADQPPPDLRYFKTAPR